MVSIIIPALNESKRIEEILSQIKGHPKVVEIIVVDDGSSDGTSYVVRNFVRLNPDSGVRLIQLEHNLGKADAMEIGVQQASSDVIMFLDADVIGFTHQKMSAIMDPVLDGKYEMFVGVNARRIYILNKLLRVVPIISGARALTKNLWNSIPKKHKKNFMIEIALNYGAKQTELGMNMILIEGMRHTIKERKYGLWRGFIARVKMCVDVITISLYLYFFAKLVRILKNAFRIVSRNLRFLFRF